MRYIIIVFFKYPYKLMYTYDVRFIYACDSHKLFIAYVVLKVSFTYINKYISHI